MKDDTFIIIDKEVAVQFLHHSNHLKWEWVPEDVKKMKIMLRTGKECTIGELIDQAKRRVDVLANYIRLATEKLDSSKEWRWV